VQAITSCISHMERFHFETFLSLSPFLNHDQMVLWGEAKLPGGGFLCGSSYALEHSFSVAAPMLWDTLLSPLRSLASSRFLVSSYPISLTALLPAFANLNTF